MPTAHGDGLYKGEEDKPAIFYVDASELKGDLFVQVDGKFFFNYNNTVKSFFQE